MTQLFLTSPLYDKILKTVHSWTFRERERETDRQTDRQRQTERQTDRQREKLS